RAIAAARLAFDTTDWSTNRPLRKRCLEQLQAALEALGQEIDSSPRLVIRAGELDDANRARIERLCADAGFSGVVAFREEPGAPPAAFQLEWADGRAAFEPEAAFARMREALDSALAAEAGHADTLTPEPTMEGRP
ncbi:MAG: hypothetical protein RDU12_06610, partial [Brevundimonas sp.]|nr:hypothetical protein [Brevundimonas sp.]